MESKKKKKYAMQKLFYREKKINFFFYQLIYVNQLKYMQKNYKDVITLDLMCVRIQLNMIFNM